MSNGYPTRNGQDGENQSASANLPIGRVLSHRKEQGMTKEFIYYLEDKKYIQPQKYSPGNGKIQRRLYTGEQAAFVVKMWDKCQEGYPPKKAKELIDNEIPVPIAKPLAQEPIIAYLLVKSGSHETERTLEYLKIYEEFVQEAGIVFGKWDLIAKIVVPNMRELRRIVIDGVKAQKSLSQQRTETLFVVDPNDRNMYWQNKKHSPQKNQMIAYVFVRASFGGGRTVISALQEGASSQICEAATVYGSTDVIVKITGKTMEEITGFIHNVLRAASGVESTDTLILQSGDAYYMNKQMLESVC